MTIEKHSDHDAVARELDSQIRQLAAHAHVVLDALRVLIEEARTSEIHTTLGFPSWTAYIADALDGQWSSMLDRDKRGAAIAFLAEQGMSQRAIAKVTGASKSAVQRELIDRCPELGQVMGLDGKTYPQPDVVHGGPPAEDIERDIALDKEVSLAGEQLMEHRWHWTMDESNPERVTIEQYAADCGVAESVVRIDVTAWGAYLEAGGESEEAFLTRMHTESSDARAHGFTLPSTIEEATTRASRLTEDIRRLTKIRYARMFAALTQQPADATRAAREFGLWMRWHRTRVLWGMEDGLTLEEAAEAMGVSVLMAQDYLDGPTSSDEEFFASLDEDDEEES